MAYPDLQSFLASLERVGQLHRIKVEVDPELEITEIVTRVVQEEGPALLFERVKGSPYPLAINTFGSRRRIELALGTEPGVLGESLVRLVERLNPPSLKALWESRGALRRLLAARTRVVRRALSQEVVERPADLSSLPILKCWPGDGGRFITFPLVLTQSPRTGRRNLGIYRMHVFSSDTTGMHWQIGKGGGYHYYEAEQENMPLQVAAVLGGDPALMLSAVLPLPENLEELVFSALLRGRPTSLARGKSISLAVPANAEFVLEGVVAPHERAGEGPFGDHRGHYSEKAPFPVFRVQAVTRRRSPVYPAAVVGKPPQEDRYLGDAAQELVKPFLRLIHPEIVDVWAYYEACFTTLLVAAVETRFTKEPLKAAMALLGQGQLALTKCVVLVDPHVNVKDFSSVLREIRRHFTPESDLLLLSGVPVDTLDFTSFKMHLGSKVILDATSKETSSSPGEGLRMDPRQLCPEIRAWRLLEDTLLAVQVDYPCRDTLARLVAAEGIAGVKIIAAVSPDINLHDQADLLFGIFTRFEPGRDLLFTNVALHGVQPIYRGVMAIDATWKPGYPEPLTMDPAVQRKVSELWKEYWQ